MSDDRAAKGIGGAGKVPVLHRSHHTDEAAATTAVRGVLTAVRDYLILLPVLAEFNPLVEDVLLPILRIVSDDRDAVDASWNALTAKRGRKRLWESPRQAWQRRYGQFISEFEWVVTELTRYLPHDTVAELVGTESTRRFRRMIRLGLPALNLLRRLPDNVRPRVIDAILGFGFPAMVGPMYRDRVEADGTQVYEIPECAWHTCTGTGRPQENTCVMACKTAINSLFDADSATPLELEPHLPGLSCTLRARPERKP